MIAEAANPLLSPWRFQWHPEVWVLMAAVIGGYVYAIRVIGPRVTSRPVVDRRQLTAFVSGTVLLWFASDWPMHDISEEYLYSMHMFQHMVLSYFVPPLVLLATPRWLFDLVLAGPRVNRVARALTFPVVAGLVFNLVVMVTHIPALVNRSASNSPLHYTLHVLVVVSAFMMWTPVVAPNRDWQLGPGAKMIYLFLMSVVPTVPAAWLTFAEGVVYKHYDVTVRVWGLSVTTDQQLAGAIMKTGGSIFLWSIIVTMFFRHFRTRFSADQTYRPLTYEQVSETFERNPPPVESSR